MSVLRFSKYEGLGNDFVVVGPDVVMDAALAAHLCDRHRGIGADGVLVVDPAAPSMKVLNADGSIPEMCGNGLRCVVWHLARTGRWVADASVGASVDTGAGPHRARLHGDGDVEVWMRPPTLEPQRIPIAAEAPMIAEPLKVGDHELAFTAVGMGNPHAVTFDPIDEPTRRLVGPGVQAHARFPAGVNVGFARMDGESLVLHVLERGAGWTQACGTGACAAAVAAVVTGRAERGRPLRVELPGGPLSLVVGEAGEPVRMRGPARHVFDGAIDLETLPR